MSVIALQNELKSLLTQTKRRNPEINEQCESSSKLLDDLTASKPESEVFAILASNPQFMSPFLLGCKEPNAKICASALQCIQILAQYNGIPLLKVDELLGALMEASKQGSGIQLKILQLLPGLLFGMNAYITSDQIQNLLSVCLEMLNTNKISTVQNTAYATLQQLITGVFDRLSHSTSSESLTLSIQGQEFKVNEPLHDAAQVLLDLCDLAEQQQPKFLKIGKMTYTFTLELFELTLANQRELFEKHDCLNAVLNLRIVPLLLRSFVDVNSFPVILRVTRIFYLLLRKHLEVLTTGAEVILSTLIQHSQKGVIFKQILCLEVLQSVCSQDNLLMEIYSQFDESSERSCIIQDLVSTFSKGFSENDKFVLASEIDTDAYHSSLTKTPQQSSDFMVLGKNSAAPVAVIEVIDRADPPQVPQEYKYYLILKCMVSLVDNIHKHASTNTKIAQILKSLADSLLLFHSISLGIAMDGEMYKLAVRSTQRLAHTSGILDLMQLRDEFMMILIQYCNIPEDFSTKLWLSVRCCLSVRALFSLGYALGNQLESSWVLIVQVITTLFDQINPEFDPTIDNLLGTEDQKYKIINVSLNMLVENTRSLSNSAINYLVSATEPKKHYRHNMLLESLSIVNLDRLADPESGAWLVVAHKLLDSAIEGSTPSTQVIDHLGYELIALENRNPETHSMVMQIFCEVALKCPESIQILCINDLNDILEKFGAGITGGWEDIFRAISPIPAKGNLELLKSAFNTLELVTSDFLENLPYSCVFSLTTCLDEFSRQIFDLNLSFTATSLIWSVCDYLIRQNSPTLADDFHPKNEQQLVEIAQNDKCEGKQAALWLLALLKLSRIGNTVGQQQVRTSAFQIFLKQVNAHGDKLSSGVWNAALSLVFPNLLLRRDISEPEFTEIQTVIIDGISKALMTYKSTICKLTEFPKFWSLWLEYLNQVATKSPGCASSAYSSLTDIISSPEYSDWKPSVGEFWLNQNALPPYSESHGKQTADSLLNLLNLYTLIPNSMDSSKATKLIGQVAMFPFYTYAARDEMSPLQQKAVDLIDNKLAKISSPLVEVLCDLALCAYKSQEQNFEGISRYAFIQLFNLTRKLPSLEQDLDGELFENDFELEHTLTYIMKSMNQALGRGSYSMSATQIFLKVMSVMQTVPEQEITPAFESLINDSCGSAEITKTEALDGLNQFIETLKAKSVQLSTWSQILELLRDTSVFYERSIHNLDYYKHPNPVNDEVMRFGTVEPPKSLNRPREAAFALRMLAQLSTDANPYSEPAQTLFASRTRATLIQYAGDSKLSGQEPARELLELELKTILELLPLVSIQESTGKHELITLILACLPYSDSKFLPQFQHIMSIVSS